MKNKKLVRSESKFLLNEKYLGLRLTIFYNTIFFGSESYYISIIYDITIK